jgi:hypothetical protein
MMLGRATALAILKFIPACVEEVPNFCPSHPQRKLTPATEMCQREQTERRGTIRLSTRYWI